MRISTSGGFECGSVGAREALGPQQRESMGWRVQHTSLLAGTLKRQQQQQQQQWWWQLEWQWEQQGKEGVQQSSSLGTTLQ
ncbi:hypothetical protein CLOM_g23655 [Closterium sp. NIES-68]|nr:hypothetical protein CLOM_g23655 [Closterium sp. NIES-68]